MRRAWIVLFMIALLPLRGWAVVSMAPAPDQGAWAPSSSHAHAAPSKVAAALPPCHGAAAGSALAVDSPPGLLVDADAGGTASSSMPAHLCLACDLCHTPLATPALPALLPPGALPAAPSVGSERDTGRHLAATLERPPRR